MNILNILFVYAVVLLLISFGLGLVLGGKDRGLKILQWELKQLFNFGRWIVKQVFQLIAKLCNLIVNSL